MKNQYILHGWHLSFFSGKMRAYMRYKGLDFLDKPVNAYDLTVRIPKKTGAVVMPVVQTDKGEWLQDTTVTIDTLERRHPAPSVVPNTPVQHFAALLIEAWADEWWVPIAMHYRWSYPENYALFEHDAGKALLPIAPNVLRKKLVEKAAAGKLRAYLPSVGVVPEQFELMERWTNQILDALEGHFAEHDYLFGGQASVADFALVGPMYGHLNRDPMPKRELLDVRPNLQAWVDRVHGGEKASGKWLDNDQIPDTLAAVFNAIFNEFKPMIEQIAAQVAGFVKAKGASSGDKVPRSLGEVSFPMADGKFSRLAMPYSLWMVQRVADCYRGLATHDQTAVDQWLATQGQAGLDKWSLGPALKRHALATRLA